MDVNFDPDLTQPKPKKNTQPVSNCLRLGGEATHHPLGRSVSAGQTSRQEVAPSGGFPVEHFPRAKHTRASCQHQVRAQGRQGHPSGSADRLGHRAGIFQGTGKALMRAARVFGWAKASGELNSNNKPILTPSSPSRLFR